MPESAAFSIHVIHAAVAGRLRLKVEGIYRAPELTEHLRNEFLHLPGVREVFANPLTESVLLFYSPENTSIDQLVEASRHLLKKPKGLNTLPIPPRRSNSKIILGQLNTLPVLLLLGAVAVSFITSGVADGVVILAVVVINTAIGYLTESSAEKVIGSLAHVSSHQGFNIIRNGIKQKVPLADISVGDVLTVSPGMGIPADIKLLSSNRLTVDESILTGESTPVEKSALPPNSKTNFLYRGTVVTGGNGEAVVIAIGSDTEIGRIQLLMGETPQPETPLQIQLRHLGHRVVKISLLLSAVITLIGILRRGNPTQIFRTAVSLAIAAIPESLPTIATSTLARGMRALEKEGVLVRHLDALETLGGVDILCLDKTGTLTLNDMTVTEVVTVSKRYSVTSSGYFHGEKKIEVQKHSALNKLIRVVTLCNDAKLSARAGAKRKGSSTELALLKLSELAGIDSLQLRTEYRKLTTRYRTENRSYMTTVHRLVKKKSTTSQLLVATKGRPDEVLELCDSYLSHGKIRPLSETIKKRISQENERMAQSALRVLGVSYKESSRESQANMIWVGLVGMMDPLRPGLKEWISKIHQAGIRTVMITGDQLPTAKAIGKALNLSAGEPLRVFDSSHAGLIKAADSHVFARVNPSDKLGIIQLLQAQGKVVAMLGDGINDGPALKIANVGIAVGTGEMDVAAKAADIILFTNNSGDDFGKLLASLREGRRIQDDIKKAVDYILVQNAAELLFTFLAVLFGQGEPLTPMQYLWMNLVTDIFPELALAQEPAEPGTMTRKPIHAQDRLLSKGNLGRMFFESSALAFSTLAAYLFTNGKGTRAKTQQRARTVAFLTLVGGSLLYTLSARSEKSTLFGKQALGSTLEFNRYIPWSIGAGLFAEALTIGVPALRKILGTSQVSWNDLVVCTLGAFAPQVAIQIAKEFKMVSHVVQPQLTQSGETRWDYSAAVKVSH